MVGGVTTDERWAFVESKLIERVGRELSPGPQFKVSAILNLRRPLKI